MRGEEMACSRCGAVIRGDCVMAGSLMFCGERCESESRSDAVGAESRDPNRGLSAIRNEDGKVGWAVLWLLGVPIPVLIVLYLLRGCT